MHGQAGDAPHAPSFLPGIQAKRRKTKGRKKKEIGHLDANIELILGAKRTGATCLARAQSDVCTGAEGFAKTSAASV